MLKSGALEMISIVRCVDQVRNRKLGCLRETARCFRTRRRNITESADLNERSSFPRAQHVSGAENGAKREKIG